MIETIGLVVLGAVVSLAAGFLIQRTLTTRKIGDATVAATRIVSDAERDAQARLKSADLEAKESALRARTDFEQETRRREREIDQVEQRILVKEEQLARKLEDIERRLSESTSKDR